MHARIARYTYEGDVNELAARVESGMLPIFQGQPGFRSYTVIAMNGEVISLSAWDTAESADAANRAAASWVADNLADQVELQEASIGEILFSTALGVSTRTGARA